MKKSTMLIAILLLLTLFLAACGSAPESVLPPINETGQSGFTIHYIDVGQADSALVICDGRTMLIDGGNAADSDLIYTFLKNQNVSHLDYIVASHAHEDHVGGLAGALNYATVGVALCPVTEYDSRAFRNFVKYLDEQNVTITVPEAGDTFLLGSAYVEIFSPLPQSSRNPNTSIVLKITYGATSFLFTGDAERPIEQGILDAGYDISATVLKVGHHGSDTSTTYPFLREIMPQYAVISCGTGNPYGHPHENTLSRLRDADVTVFRTDLQGSITCASDGNTVSFVAERNADIQTNPTEPVLEENRYIGNTNTNRFHRPSCSGLPMEKNRIIFDSREAAISEGYSSCGNCKP